MLHRLNFDKDFTSEELAAHLKAAFPMHYLWPYDGENGSRAPYIEFEWRNPNEGEDPAIVEAEVSAFKIQLQARLDSYIKEATDELEFEEKKAIKELERILKKSAFYKSLEDKVAANTAEIDKLKK